MITLADWKVTKRQITLVNQVLKSGRLTYGPFHEELEKKFAKMHDFKYCIFVSSGTAALEVAWAYLKEINNWPDGAEVIVPSVTFVATINMLLVNRLKPVLVDVDPESININPELVHGKLTKKTVAICPVDLLGRPVDIQAILKIARKNKLKIVEDSCETMFVGNPPVGSKADIAVYSSYLAHIISTGVGGYICTNNKKWAQDLRSMIWHGRDNYYLSIDDNAKNKKKLLQTRFKFNRVGYSSRLTEMEAALGVDELDRGWKIIIVREGNAISLYGMLRQFEDKLILPNIHTENAWMFFPIVCKYGVDRDKLVLFLEEKGIQTRAIMPLINQPVYQGMWNPQDFPVAQWLDKKGFLIGIHQFLTLKDLKYVAKTFKEYFND